MSDDPPPIRRAAIGCLALAIVGFGFAALVRPLIFSVAPPRDDSVVIVGTLTDAAAGPIRSVQLLSRSYGYDGELDAGDGRVEVTVIASATDFGGVTVVNAASPNRENCPVGLGADRLVDCDGRTWTYEGLPIDSADPPLQRFPATIEDGAIVVDFTRRTEP
ncbi:MAG TPA: hypothetical protein VF365_10045 [Candidatus Limnocylindria bacterium]